MTGARIGQMEMNRRRQESRAELIKFASFTLDKWIRMYYLAQELLERRHLDVNDGDPETMCRWSSSDTIKNVQYIMPCLGTFGFMKETLCFKEHVKLFGKKCWPPRTLPPRRFVIRRLFPF